MSLVEFAEKTSPVPLTEWQKQFLKACEQEPKGKMWLIFNAPRVSGRYMLACIIEKFEKENRQCV